MANKPMPPRRGLPDDAASDADDNIGAGGRSGGGGGRFLTEDPTSHSAPRRGRRMLPADDEAAPPGSTNVGSTHVSGSMSLPGATRVSSRMPSQYAKPGPSPVPPPPTPVPPFRGGRSSVSAPGATVIAASSATTEPAASGAAFTPSATDQAKTKPVWSPGPVSGSDDAGSTADGGPEHGDDADVLHHAPRTAGRRVRIIGLVAGGLAMAVLAFFGIRALNHQPNPGPASTAPAVSPAAAPPFTTDDLPTVEEAALVAPGEWTIHETVETVNENSPLIACVGSTQAGTPPPTLSRIRLLNTPSGGPAMVTRLDAYASIEAAQQTYQALAAKVSGCSNEPAYLTGGSTVTGLADEVTQVTVSYQDAKATLFHTVLIARVGNSIAMTDVINKDKAIGAQQTVDGTKGTVARFCKAAKGTCPSTPKASAPMFPPTTPLGWLAPNDIPRVRAGAGQWSANDPVAPTANGAFCENVTLIRTDTKKAGRRTYLLAQDSAMPEFFGLDEVSLTFGDEAAAKAFADTMSNNIVQCPDRTGVAKILESAESTITGADGKPITAKTWKFSLDVDQLKYWQVAVVTTGTHTIYLMTNTDANYGFTKEQYLQVALRSGIRATQAT